MVAAPSVKDSRFRCKYAFFAVSLEPRVRGVVQRAVIPDLLHPTPTVRVQVESTELAMSLAFAGGTSGGLFAEALASAPMAPSSWQPESFARDLFLNEFVSACFRVKLDGREPTLMTRHLVRLMAHPPSDPAIPEYRRTIVIELMQSKELRQKLEHLYQVLCLFRAELEGLSGSSKLDSNRRQLDVLAGVKQIVECMASGFVAARSGLSRCRTHCSFSCCSPLYHRWRI